MRLAISNIAWETAEDEQVAALLNRHQIDAIDVAPSMYFPDPRNTTTTQLQRVRDWWQSRGISVTGMQALLFGTTELNLFGSPDSQQAMLDHLEAVCRIGAGLGATRLVFGSPRNRDCSGLTPHEIEAISTRFFRALGETAAHHGVLICLEPNPSCYGANFMTNSADTARTVTAVNHPAIRMQLDTGALAINGEDAAAVIDAYGPLIGHVHASEPNLVTLGGGAVDHVAIGALLTGKLPEQVVSIEMIQAKQEPNIVSIERALAVAIRGYRNHGGTA
jgi:sugar phosphate isomerase/epimerase